MPDISKKPDQGLESWIANYERKGLTDAPFYRELLEERGRRSTFKHKLDPERSLKLLMEAARTGTCTTYGALSKASGVDWNKARHAMNGKSGHLARLLDICHARGLPLLPALCVNERGLATCELDGDALQGFADGARRVGMAVLDENAFHREQREASWEWGRR